MRYALASLVERKDILFLSLIAFLPISRAVLFVRNTTTRAISEYAEVDFQNGINIVATLLMLFLVLRSKARESAVNTLRGPTQWFLAYLVFCMVSSIWAGNLTYVVYRAVELIAVLFFMAHVLDTVGDPVEAIRYLCRFSALTALLPYLAMAVRNGGIFQHTNSFSTSGAFGAALALASIRRGVLRLGDVKWSLTACLAAVVLGTSSASNISLIIGVLMIVAASRGRAVSVTRLVLISTVAFLVLTVGFEVVRPYLFPGKTTEHIRSLRGRTTLYQGFWDAFQEHPFLGYGFASGEKSIKVSGGVVFNSAHNSVLSVAVNTGIVGLTLFFVGFYRILSILYRADALGYNVAYPILVAMVVGLINSMSYPLVGSDWRFPTTPFLGIVAYASVFFTPEYCTTEGDAELDFCETPWERGGMN